MKTKRNIDLAHHFPNPTSLHHNCQKMKQQENCKFFPPLSYSCSFPSQYLRKKKQKKTHTHTLLTKCSICFGSFLIIHHVSRSFMFMLDKMSKFFSIPFSIIQKYVSNKNIPTKNSLSIALFLKFSHTKMLHPTKSKLLPLTHFPNS